MIKKTSSKRVGLYITDLSTTFPVNRRGILNYLKNNIGLTWVAQGFEHVITKDNLELIAKNTRLSRYYSNNCYILNSVLTKNN